ncbi:MAG: hypothetical protein ACR2HJ_05370 [Fimbriimonadales bacterium]
MKETLLICVAGALVLLLAACAPPEKEPARGSGPASQSWTLEVDTNRINQSVNVTLILSDATVRDTDPGEPTWIAFGCRGREANVIVRFASARALTERWPIRYRVDDAPIVAQQWLNLSDGSVGAASPLAQRAVLRAALAGRQTFVLEDGIHSRSATFDLIPLQQNRALFEKCVR